MRVLCGEGRPCGHKEKPRQCTTDGRWWTAGRIGYARVQLACNDDYFAGLEAGRGQLSASMLRSSWWR